MSSERSLDRYCSHRLNPGAVDIRHSNMDSIRRPHQAELQNRHPRGLCLQTSHTSGGSSAYFDRGPLGHCSSTFRPGRGSLAIHLAERRNELRHHVSYLPNPRHFRQISQHALGRYGRPGSGTVRSRVSERTFPAVSHGRPYGQRQKPLDGRRRQSSSET